MSDTKIVRAKLRKLLPTVDLDNATQRSIQQQLEEELGVPLSQHKQLIKDEIDRFLLADGEREGEGGDDNDDDYSADEQPPAKKKQKQASGAAAPAGGGPPGGYILQLSDKRFVALSQFKGKWYVGIREYYDKDGALAPSAKGVNLTPDQWHLLADNMESLSSALESRDESGSLDLGGNRRAGPSNYGGRPSLDIREWYSAADGTLKPGKKGIALPPAQWEALREGASRVTDVLLAKLGGSWPAGGAGPSSAGPSSAAAGAKPAQPAAAAAAAAGGASGEGQGEEEGGSVQLSGSRRAEVRSYQGKAMVDLREMYEKGGQWLPGKKGISLPPDQFGKLVAAAGPLAEALQNKDTQFEVELSNKRKASISCFKGTYYVNIREYYEKGGELFPGQKGLSLPADQWAKLEAALPRLEAALGAEAGGSGQ